MTIDENLTDLADQVLHELRTRALTLAVAESCTGGLVTSLLTDQEGSSDVLLYSIVAYNTDAKEEFLGIPSHIIHDHGTISLEVAKMMAEGVLEYDADVGLSTTGVIGEAIEGKLKGTVFIGVAINGQKTIARELTLDPKKSRYELKKEIAEKLFKELIDTLDSVY